MTQVDDDLLARYYRMPGDDAADVADAIVANVAAEAVELRLLYDALQEQGFTAQEALTIVAFRGRG